jgi:hypothetical protein
MYTFQWDRAKDGQDYTTRDILNASWEKGNYYSVYIY